MKLVPLSKKKNNKRKFKNKYPVIEDKLNSRFFFREVFCSEGMWTTLEGETFKYSSYRKMQKDPFTGRLSMAEKCLKYNP